MAVNKPPELSKAEALSYFARLFLPVSAVANRYGLRLALEPLGGDSLVSGPGEALEVIRINKPGHLGSRETSSSSTSQAWPRLTASTPERHPGLDAQHL